MKNIEPQGDKILYEEKQNHFDSLSLNPITHSFHDNIIIIQEKNFTEIHKTWKQAMIAHLTLGKNFTFFQYATRNQMTYLKTVSKSYPPRNEEACCWKNTDWKDKTFN